MLEFDSLDQLALKQLNLLGRVSTRNQPFIFQLIEFFEIIFLVHVYDALLELAQHRLDLNYQCARIMEKVLDFRWQHGLLFGVGQRIKCIQKLLVQGKDLRNQLLQLVLPCERVLAICVRLLRIIRVVLVAGIHG